MKKGILVFIGLITFGIGNAQDNLNPDSADLNRLFQLIQGTTSALPDSVKLELDDTTSIVLDTSEVLMPKITFEHEEFDIGSIKQGDQVEHVYKFKNEGNLELNILGVSPDCSCSAPEWTASAIAPGKMGYVKIMYDSHDDIGAIRKTLTVLHDAGEGYTFLTLLGFVEAKF